MNPTPPSPERLPEPFMDIDLPLEDRRDGKVRISYAYGDHRLFVTTDRLSAFDRVIHGVPYKGQVLNQLAAWWFEHTSDIVANHVVCVPDPNLLVAVPARPLPVEVVVRGHITGVTSTSLWRQYADGARTIYGHQLADGLHKNDALPDPIVTPTTKAAHGSHDEPLSCADVVTRGLVDPELWERVLSAALALFDRGRRHGESVGLILADTKYEFGLAGDGTLLLIDEVHTPDSSRWWIAAGCERRVAAGEEPESLDKEVVRRALLDAGYHGDGEPPALDDSVWSDASARYRSAYERLTGTPFAPGRCPVAERIAEVVEHAR